jgi:hypothetical protein
MTYSLPVTYAILCNYGTPSKPKLAFHEIIPGFDVWDAVDLIRSGECATPVAVYEMGEGMPLVNVSRKIATELARTCCLSDEAMDFCERFGFEFNRNREAAE